MSSLQQSTTLAESSDDEGMDREPLPYTLDMRTMDERLTRLSPFFSSPSLHSEFLPNVLLEGFHILPRQSLSVEGQGTRRKRPSRPQHGSDPEDILTTTWTSVCSVDRVMSFAQLKRGSCRSHALALEGDTQKRDQALISRKQFKQQGTPLHRAGVFCRQEASTDDQVGRMSNSLVLRSDLSSSALTTSST